SGGALQRRSPRRPDARAAGPRSEGGGQTAGPGVPEVAPDRGRRGAGPAALEWSVSLRAWLVGQRPWLAAFLASFWGASLGVSSASAAPRDETVLLIRPAPGARPTLLEAFNRLQGELRMHGFEMRVVEAPRPPSSATLERFADQGRAVAAVAFVEQGETTRVDIWISDRVTGKTTKRTIEPGADRHAGAVLAVRALELLRASLREYAELEPGAEELPGAHPERADAAVRALGQVTAPEHRWGVGVGVAG